MLMLSPLAASAGELRAGGMMGLRDEDRLIKLEYINRIDKIMDWKLEGGASGPMAYGTVALGLKAESGPFFVRYWVGPTIISVTSDRLSGQFQFNHDLELGIKANNGVEFMAGYKHMSNAGIAGPNLGRDWLGVGVGVHW